MPHISNRELKKETLKTLDREFSIILTEAGSKTRTRIVNELLTKTERMMLAKRIGILFFLNKGFSVYKTSRLLKVSPSTVERFSLGLQGGKYPELKQWLRNHTWEGKFEKFVTKLVALGLTGRTRSFKQMVDSF